LKLLLHKLPVPLSRFQLLVWFETAYIVVLGARKLGHQFRQRLAEFGADCLPFAPFATHALAFGGAAASRILLSFFIALCNIPELLVQRVLSQQFSQLLRELIAIGRPKADDRVGDLALSPEKTRALILSRVRTQGKGWYGADVASSKE
jgi:hypothetical protein